MIISSFYHEGPLQEDGRRYVKEYHTDSSGTIYNFEWLGAQSAQEILDERVTVLNEKIQAKANAEAFVSSTLLPMSKLEFRELFTPLERYALDAFEATFETNPDIPSDTKAVIRTGYKDFANATDIAKPFDSRVGSMLNLFVSIGVLSSERLTEIIEAGNA